MKIFKMSLLGLALILVVIQFVPAKLPSGEGNKDGDLFLSGFASGSTASILKTSCYDCHSLETTYPWYTHVAPASWLVIHDINKGREELNFSQWSSLSKREMIRQLENIKEQVKENEMPLPIYTVIHTKAKLSEDQKNILIQWVESKTDSIMGD
jgi:hypothetical protein